MKLPQLHLRDLFWLVLVCALAMGWWADGGHYELPFTMVLILAVSAFWFVIGFTSGAAVNSSWRHKERD